MNKSNNTASPLLAIACGGTGGHFFPGQSVADTASEAGWRTLLFLSDKEIDQSRLKEAANHRCKSVPAVGWNRRRPLGFFWQLARSIVAARRQFKVDRPSAFLTMGGFTGYGPALAARSLGIPCYTHESNAVMGRANRYVKPFARRVFVGFQESIPHSNGDAFQFTGTPVRKDITGRDRLAARHALGLNADVLTLLVMGGSQGAQAINQAMIEAAGVLSSDFPSLQVIHLTGIEGHKEVRERLSQSGLRSVVMDFCHDMGTVLAAADLVVSRSGGSSLAEFAALKLPSVLCPYPYAIDNHQLANARIFARAGGGMLIEQSQMSGASLAKAVASYLKDPPLMAKTRQALATIHQPRAAEDVFESMARGQTSACASHAEVEEQSVSESITGSDFLPYANHSEGGQ